MKVLFVSIALLGCGSKANNNSSMPAPGSTTQQTTAPMNSPMSDAGGPWDSGSGPGSDMTPMTEPHR